LATLGAVRGLTLYITGGIPVPNLPDSVSQLHYGTWLFGLSPNLWITLAVVVVSIPLLHFTVFGRYAFAIGSNERTARLCGVHVERWKTLCYIIAGATAGLAGAMMTATLGGRPTNFEGLELTAIAAVVIGGTSLFGGEGTVAGSILGVLMLGFLNTGCTMASLSSYVQPIFIGATIVIAAAIDRFRHLGR
jgi:ribose transport system permease protein